MKNLIVHLNCVLLLVAMLASGCSDDAHTKKETTPNKTSAVKVTDADVHAFCGDCHAVPQPAGFPREAWYDEVRRGYDFYFQAGRSDLNVPPQSAVVDWYRQRAPEELTLEKLPTQPDAVARTMRQFEVESKIARAVSVIDWDENQQEFLLSDMRSGTIFCVEFVADRLQTKWQRDGLARNPATVRRCDLNHNGIPDLVIADLGSFLPEDHDRGRVVWLPDFTNKNSQPIPILKNVGRIADISITDFNGDQRPDVVAAEFGWHATGGIHVLTNLPSEENAADASFTVQQVDSRSGAIHVSAIDWNSDGRMDFVALISQEYESVVLFLQTDDGFESQTLYSAPDPSWGSSGISLVDFDNDGDTDIIYTNGDTFDSYLAKPYHGITWLENTGEQSLVPHAVGNMPGVHRALACDMDADGDLDIVASAMLPEKTLAKYNNHEFAGIAWFEHRDNHTFRQQVISHGAPDYPTLAVGDFNSDARPDLAVGVFSDTKPQLLRVFLTQPTPDNSNR